MARRRFLTGAAGATLAIPFLSSLTRPSSARAGTTTAPKRFVFLFTSNGQRPENWLPGFSDFRTVDGEDHVREVSLTEGAGPISPILGDAFAPFRSKLLMLRGLDTIRFDFGGHICTTPLSGWAQSGDGARSGPTIDQILARSSAVYPSAPPVRSAHMLLKPAWQSETSCSSALVGGSLQSIPHLTSVSALHQQLFGDLVEVGDPLAAQRSALRGRVIDRVRERYDALRSHPRLSGQDRRTLEAHVEHLTAIEARIGATSATCTRPGEVADLDLDDETNLAQATRDVLDLAASAIQCDRTRVMTIMLTSGTDIRHGTYLPGGPCSADHHSLSHDAPYSAPSSADLLRANRWFGEQIAYLLSRLDQVEDEATGATYLDNTLVYWGNEDGCNHRDAHWTCNMPVLLAGGLGGHFRTGRYIDYRRVTGPDGSETGDPILYPYDTSLATLEVFRGRLYNSLLLSILEGFGVPAEEYREPDGGIGDYSNNAGDQYSIPLGRLPLPALT